MTMAFTSRTDGGGQLFTSGGLGIQIPAATLASDALQVGGVVTNSAATYTVLSSDNTIVQTTIGATYTLLNAASYVGKELKLMTQFSGAVISASSNVIPLAGGAAGTAILAATAGKWALLKSNGTSWQIVFAN